MRRRADALSDPVIKEMRRITLPADLDAHIVADWPMRGRIVLAISVPADTIIEIGEAS